MLDLKKIEELSATIKADLTKRGLQDKITLVDEILKKNTEWKKIKEQNDLLRNRRNVITREINELRKTGNEFKPKIAEAKELPAKIIESDEKLDKLWKRIQAILQILPNTLHESVPIGKDDTENKEIKKWGEPKTPEFLINHGELLEKRGLADFNTATKISGAGFHYLKGDLVRLELALINYAVDELGKKGFIPVEPPFIMRRKPYEGVVAIEDFENVMYKIEGEDSYLIATSEHPIGAMHMGKTFDKSELPLKYLGISSCFRREIGSHGVDTRGLFRVHQFAKIEMFVFCEPSMSWKFHEELLAIAESLVKKLKIPYRVVNVCSGDMGSIAAKKYDIEGWFPRQEKYGELVSCSNCTEYQAVSLNIKYDDGVEKNYVHTLNSTAIALGRMMVAILENYQQKDGSIKVPLVLQKYMGKEAI